MLNNTETAIELLRRMLLIREVEETIALKYAEQKMRCPTHLSIGQEAVAAAAGIVLVKQDQAVSTHRAHAHYIGKGGKVRAMIAELYGKATGCSAGKGGSMHLIDTSAGFMGSTAIVGNTIPVGVGIALANKRMNNGCISCIFLGDAAVEEGAFHEAANFAVLQKLPVLFICENNLYSVYSPLYVRQPVDRIIHQQAESYGMPSVHADGNDAESVFQELEVAVARVRDGKGPVFCEFSTYRWREHCGPNYDNDLGYRTIEEYETWRERDPIPRYEDRLKARGVLDEDGALSIAAECRTVVDDAFQFAEESAFPEPDEAYQHIFMTE